jgi:hypothetical protein
MQSNGSFDARFVSRGTYNLYRIYVRGSDLYFINLGGVSTVTRVVTSQLGLVGALIDMALKKRAKRQVEALLQSADGQDPESLLRGNKSNFKLYAPEIGDAAMESPSLWAMHGKQAGRWNFKLRDGKKFRFEFVTAGAMKAAVELLAASLNATLRVNVEWNDLKKKFQKPKTHG